MRLPDRDAVRPPSVPGAPGLPITAANLSAESSRLDARPPATSLIPQPRSSAEPSSSSSARGTGVGFAQGCGDDATTVTVTNDGASSVAATAMGERRIIGAHSLTTYRLGLGSEGQVVSVVQDGSTLRYTVADCSGPGAPVNAVSSSFDSSPINTDILIIVGGLLLLTGSAAVVGRASLLAARRNGQ